MKILFATWSSSGPLRPLVPLVHAARNAGHDVVVMGENAVDALELLVRR